MPGRPTDARASSSPATSRRWCALHDAAPELIRRINLGGLHHRPDRRELLRYLYLGSDDEGLVRRLRNEGVEVVAQDVPTTAAVSLDALLR